MENEHLIKSDAVGSSQQGLVRTSFLRQVYGTDNDGLLDEKELRASIASCKMSKSDVYMTSKAIGAQLADEEMSESSQFMEIDHIIPKSVAPKVQALFEGKFSRVNAVRRRDLPTFEPLTASVKAKDL